MPSTVAFYASWVLAITFYLAQSSYQGWSSPLAHGSGSLGLWAEGNLLTLLLGPTFKQTPKQALILRAAKSGTHRARSARSRRDQQAASRRALVEGRCLGRPSVSYWLGVITRAMFLTGFQLPALASLSCTAENSAEWQVHLCQQDPGIHLGSPGGRKLTTLCLAMRGLTELMAQDWFHKACLVPC